MISGAAVSVLDYGADPSGSSDSASAIQAAFNAAQSISACVYIPYGIYLLNSSITAGANVKGVFSNGGTLKRNSTAAQTMLILPDAEFTVQGLIVDGNSQAFTIADPTLYIDVLTVSNKVIVSGCRFKNACGTSIGGQAEGVQISECDFEEWLDHSIYFSGTTTPTNATSIVINGNNFKHGNSSDNGCIKLRNNVTNVTINGNVLALQSSTPFVQDDQGGIAGLGDGLTYFNKRITIANNSGECVYFYGKTTDTPVTDVFSTKSITTLEGNSVFCTFFAYLGNATIVSIGDLNVLNNTVQGVLLWFRNIDNTDYLNTINVQGNTVFGDLIVCENTMPSRLTVKSNNLFISTFFIANNLADADTSARTIEIENNYIVKSGSALAKLIDHANLQENTSVYVLGNYIQNVSFITNSMGNGPLNFTIDANVSTGGAVTTSNSQQFTLAAGSLVISNNTFGGRLMLENANAKTSCMLTRYNAYIFGNRTDNVAEVVYTFGAPVTGYAGSNKFYSEGNFGLNTTVSNGYPVGAKAALPSISL